MRMLLLGAYVGFAVLAVAACEPARDAGMPPDAAAGTAAAGLLRVEAAWAPPADTAAVGYGAAYFTLHNAAAAPVRVAGVRAEVARVAELHQSYLDAGVMRMRPALGGVVVPPGDSLAFAPGGYHVMLIGLQRSLVPGDRFPLVLVLEPGGEQTVGVVVRPR